MADAKFIVIEGLNHSGKSTQVARLVEKLHAEGIKAEANKEPTQRIFGKIIRKLVDKESPTPAMLYEAVGYLRECGIPRHLLSHNFVKNIEAIIDKLRNGKTLDELELQLLFFADRCDDIINVIKSRLKNNIWNIQDRFDLSTFAHGLSWGLKFEAINGYHAASVARLDAKPDILIFITASPREAFKRLCKDKEGKQDKNEESVKQLSETLSHYVYLVKNPFKRKLFFKDHLEIVNGEQSIEEVSEDIWRVVRRWL